ncbi:MAG: hypothetical protein IKP73_07420 [Bacteroidales bacterium]|nr:hypothetical protein [Bacteroidales bacterium]MBR4325337.1 hypothetical protein [Bacteroidales bacterium]
MDTTEKNSTGDNGITTKEMFSKAFSIDFEERMRGTFEVSGEFDIYTDSDNAANNSTSEMYGVEMEKFGADEEDAKCKIWLTRKDIDTMIAVLHKAKEYVDIVRSRIDSETPAPQSTETNAVNANE